MPVMWGGRELTKSEEQLLSRMLDKITEEILKLSSEINVLVRNVRTYIDEQKALYDEIKGLVDDMPKLVEIQKSLKSWISRYAPPEVAVKMIMSGRWRHPEIVKYLQSYVEQQRQNQELPSVIKEVLKGAMSPSQFAVYVMKKRERGEDIV